MIRNLSDKPIRALVVEDSDSDFLLLREHLSEAPDPGFSVARAVTSRGVSTSVESPIPRN